ncbi:putative nuclease HARBI1 [Sinocyclocheilus grahami]|uniref:putative nuclease HARBI1 n=1 Tax=Sinocyclocheilus grahami TaxID=75366 RepID=UPI0007ACBA22|nr:PREDICTED: putative nuclease HARBI1 [Sinocyclocheilus grahami]
MVVSRSFIEVVGKGYGLSKTSVWRCVHTVTNALLRHAGDYIRLPATRQEVQEVHQGCHAIAGIPRVLGLVDGTLIPIANPSVIDQAYISRKGYAAINVQVIVDHRGVISDLVARWPGSTHDSFVWANSAVGEQVDREGFGQSLFLGDSGYPLRTYLFTPLTNPQTRSERAYNVAHVRTRNIVECAIGIWKLRFRCLHKSAGGLRIKPHSSCAVTVATAILYNMAVRGGAPIPEGEEEEVEADEEEDGEGEVEVLYPPQRAALG